MKLMHFTITWFDILLVAVIVGGIFHGRKRGMSAELLDVLQWLCIVVVSAILYKDLGNYLAAYTNLSYLSSYIVTYLFLAIMIKLFFIMVRKAVGEKLIGSDLFGSSEYYLGMAGGAVRYACILLFFLSLLHAKQISPEQLAAQRKVQKDNFGDIAFPTFGTVQHAVFNDSATGPYIQRYLEPQLIASTPPATRATSREGVGRSRERVVEEALGQKL
jgi:uncharacterized membrane protein required for colicin V production